VALTDHDTTAGLARFLAAGAGRSVRCVAGVELSAEHHPGTLHLLGYFIQPDSPALQRGLETLRAGRAERNQEILARLNALGVDLAWEDVLALAGGEVVGRPHFARALIARGRVADKEEAFDRYLARGQPAYVERFRLMPAATLQLIRAAGGVAVLAHPHSLKMGRKELRALVMELCAAGLEGLEVLYPEHAPDEVRQYRALARELNLVPTGGSDFHGVLSPDIQLGRGFGALRVPDDVLPRLEARRPR